MPVKDAAITETWRQCSAFSRVLCVTVTALHLSGSDTVSTGPTALISLAFAPTPANVAVFFLLRPVLWNGFCWIREM